MSRKKNNVCVISTSDKTLERSLGKLLKACRSGKKVDSGMEHGGLQTWWESVSGLYVFTLGVSIKRSNTSDLPDS